jgi:hypothetical protein
LITSQSSPQDQLLAEFIYSTRFRESGPWLIDAAKLEVLDKILEQEKERLHKLNEEAKAHEVEEQMRKPQGFSTSTKLTDEDLERIDRRVRELPWNKEESSLVVFVQGDKKIAVESFTDALRQPGLLDEIPIGFEASLKSREIRGEIELGPDSLEISVSPEHSPEAREMFAALKHWANSVKPTKWQQIWLSSFYVAWVAYFFILYFAVSIAVDTGVKSLYKQQADQLLENGLSQDEQVKATELLLKIATNQVPPNSQSALPSWFILLSVGGLLACTVLSIRPSSRLGIGKGETSIKRWRTWMQFVFIAVPVFVLSNFVVPLVVKLITNLSH